MNEQELNDNAVRSECIEAICDDLAAVRTAVPMLLEEYILAAAYRSALALGWGDNDTQLKWIFRRVAACLRWPIPQEIA